MYVFFPITMFTYFSNPAVYEKELIEMYKKHNLPTDEEELRILEEVKERVRKEKVEALRAKVRATLNETSSKN